MQEDEKLIPIARFDSTHLTHIVKLRLESEGIPVVIQGRAPSPFTGTHAAPWGGQQIRVRESDKERAEEILREAAADSPDEEWAPLCPQCRSKTVTLQKRAMGFRDALKRLLAVCRWNSIRSPYVYEYVCRQCGHSWNDHEGDA